MLNLQMGPEWLGAIPSNDPNDLRPFLLPGVRVRFEPIGIKAVRAARAAVRDALGEDAADLLGAGDALSRELIKRGIVEWEGVGDLKGNPIEPTIDLPELDELGAPIMGADGAPIIVPGTISAFVKDSRAYEAADDVYVRPWAARDMEGNASAGSPNGTSTKAMPAPDTANSRAKPRRANGAKPIRKPAAKAAPIAKMSRLPKKAKLSGR